MAETVDDFSRVFYPFLHGDEERPQGLREELRFSLLEKARESIEVKIRHIMWDIAHTFLQRRPPVEDGDME
jgi:hypothetical protein